MEKAKDFDLKLNTKDLIDELLSDDFDSPIDELNTYNTDVTVTIVGSINITN